MKYTKEEVKEACDKLVKEGKLKVVGHEENGDPIYIEDELLDPSESTKDCTAMLLVNVFQGDMEIVGEKNGEPLFSLTEQGRKKVDGWLKENPRLFMEMGLDDGKH